MAINTSLLIAAPMLQDYLVDKTTGDALAAGTVSLFQDNSRTTYKNWYYQTGTPGNYTYLTLPNPMTLTGVGTITDPNGNDTIPFYYPYSETDNETPQPYYVVVTDSNGQLQFTRQNFPFVAHQSTPGNQVNTLENYIINNVFWRNIGTMTLTNVLQTTLAPDQHDGFTMPDFQFIKNVTGAVDTVTFTKFPLGISPLQNDITPEFYCNFACTGATTGETQKVFQIPISLHVETLENVSASVVIHAQNNGGTSNTITLLINQFLGTGVAANPPITLMSIPLTDGWTKYIIPFTFPSAAGLILGVGGDDALYLQIGMPLNTTCNLNFTKPQLYLNAANDIPTNEFQTYDQIDAVINSPRTGDVRTSINQFYPFGWVPMNNGTIGNATASTTSNATARANQDTWPLFNLLWNYAKTYDYGSNFNPICQMYTSAGAATNYGASAIADFTALNALALTSMFGEVVSGSVPISALLSVYNQPITASNSGGHILITVSNGSVFFTGQAVTFTTTGTLPGNLSTTGVYYITNISGNTFNITDTYNNALAGMPVIAFASAGSNSSMNANITGSQIGHTNVSLSIPNMPAHNHPGSTVSLGSFAAAAGGTSVYSTPTPMAVPVTVAFQGTGAPFNLISPQVAMNIYMKL